jgi:hypothetical protein
MTASTITPGSTLGTEDMTFSVNVTRLLSESGQLFASADDAFTEIVQNAYRAGARTLTIRANPANRTVSFHDDGAGCATVADVFTLAASGWDETSVINAAGIGAFALFAISEQVTVRSFPCNAAAWECTFDGSAFRLKSFPVRSFERRDTDPLHGFEISATLKETATFPSFVTSSDVFDRHDRPHWLHRFPLTVTLVTPAAGVTLLPKQWPDDNTIVPTRVGQLVLDGDTRYHNDTKVIWEHRAAGRLAFAVMCGTATNAVHAALLKWIFQRNPIWCVDPTSDVRPQLPARDTLIRDLALARALGWLRDDVARAANLPAVRAWLLAVVGDRREVVLDALADQFKAVPHVLGRPVPSELLRALLADIGFSCVKVGALPTEEDVSVSHDGEGTSFESSRNRAEHWVRPSYRCADPESAVRAGLWASSEALGVPKLSVAWDAAYYSRAVGMIFATGLRLVTSEGTVMAKIPLIDGDGDSINDVDVADLGITGAMLGCDDLGTLYGVMEVPQLTDLVGALRDHRSFRGLLVLKAKSSELDYAYDFVSGSGEDCAFDSAALIRSELKALGEERGGEEARRATHDEAREALRDAVHAVHAAEYLAHPLKRAKAAGVSRKVLKAARALQRAVHEAKEAFG